MFIANIFCCVIFGDNAKQRNRCYIDRELVAVLIL